MIHREVSNSEQARPEKSLSLHLLDSSLECEEDPFFCRFPRLDSTEGNDGRRVMLPTLGVAVPVKGVWLE